MIKVSVIVPVYNVEQFLDTCLQSLIKQTLKEIEIIIVNDGTKDHSQLIIDRYANEYSQKVFAYHKDNGGLSSARNFGMQKARGEYVAFVDSDDYVSLDMYEKMYQKAKEKEFDMVCCDFNEIHDEKIISYSCKIQDDILTKAGIKTAMVDFYPSAWNKIYKTALLNELTITFKEGVWFEDVEFIYRLLPYISNIGIVHQNFYQYLIRNNSITNTSDEKIYDYISNWNGIISYYQEKQLFEEYYDILEYCYVRYLYATFIKSACKFEKKAFKNAVELAIQNVQTMFPNYVNNVYLKQNSAKNILLKYFSKTLAKFVYIKYHR